MTGSLVEMVGVSKSFESGGGPIRILDDVSFAVSPGEGVALVGPSGSGKSTILNLLGGLDQPDSGHIRFEGKDLMSLAPEALAEFRNRRIGFVFQSHHLLPHCTVWENVLVPCLASKESVTPEEESRARKLLDRVGLASRATHLPGRLSGGERQRAALVRALIQSPSLVLADEPTGALDRSSAADVADLLAELQREQGVALVVVTHSPELAARFRRVFRMDSGRLVEGAAS